MKATTRFAQVLTGVVFAASHAVAAEGDLDPTFGDGGFVLSGITDGLSNLVAGMAVQADGRLVICGSEGEEGAVDFYVARFTRDGDLDASFSFDGRATIDFGDEDYCNGLAIQADGKIVVGGYTRDTGTGNADFAIARLNPDGSLDMGGFGAGTGKVVVPFDLGGTNQDIANAVALRPDGRIVLAGWASTASNGADFAILQLNTDGTRDTGFNLTGRATVGFDLGGDKYDTANALAIDHAGRIVAAGQASRDADSADMAIARLLPNGQPDPDFSADGRATVAFDLGGAGGANVDTAIAMHIDRQERIVLAGSADSSATSGSGGDDNFDAAVARLLPDGSLDVTFGIGGKTVIAYDFGDGNGDYGLAILEQGNGRLYIAGTSLGANAPPAYEYATLMRLRPNGVPDGTFGAVGKRQYDFGQSMPSGQLFNRIAYQGDRIVLGGALNAGDIKHIDFLVARVTDDVIFAYDFE